MRQDAATSFIRERNARAALQKQETHMMINKLRERLELVPRNRAGDPAFRGLNSRDGEEKCVLDVFSEQEVVELVNRCLYQLEYQARSHAKYGAERRELERRVRDVFKTLYPEDKFSRAVPEQITKCMEVLKQKPYTLPGE